MYLPKMGIVEARKLGVKLKNNFCFILDGLLFLVSLLLSKPCWPRQQGQSDNFPCPLQLIKVTPGLGNNGSNQPEPKPAPVI